MEKFMLGIVCAMENEARPVIDLMKWTKETKYAGKKIVDGELFGRRAVLCVSDIGKVNAAMGAYILIEKFKVDVILNFGVVGSVNLGLKLCDIVVGDAAIQYDFDISGVEDVERGQLRNFPDKLIPLDKNFTQKLAKKGFRVGHLATTDAFRFNSDNLLFLRLNDVEAEDMEIAAIAQVCNLTQVPVVSVKSVSNAVDEHGAEVYGDSVYRAIGAYAEKIEQIVRVIYGED